jgi:hypothetical protein
VEITYRNQYKDHVNQSRLWSQHHVDIVSEEDLSGRRF